MAILDSLRIYDRFMSGRTRFEMGCRPQKDALDGALILEKF